MTRRLFRGLAFAWVFGAALANAWAQEREGDQVVYRKRTVIDLSGAVIQGELIRPEGSYIVNRKVSRFSTLITTRRDFVPELLASPDLL